jgi:hypothetical protein
MKKFMFLALVYAAALQLHAQEALILQRVHVAETEIADPESVPPLFSDAGRTLFELINMEQPVISSSEEDANSTISTRIEPAEAGTSIRFGLSTGGEGVTESIAVIPNADRIRSYNEFLNRTAAEFARYLGRVPPEVRIQELATDEETREVLEELLFVESMLKPFEASLWLGVATKRAGDADAGEPYYLHFPRHYFGEFTWFPVPSHGVSGTLFLEYSDFMSHADSVLSFEEDGRSDNLYILPGLGYTYRTLGRFSAGFFAGLNAGALRITAREDLVYEDGLNLQDGESEWVFFHFVVLKPFVSYALNESWSIKTSFSLYITLLQMLPGPFQTDYYNQGDPGAEIQFLNVGVSYRW